MSADQNISKEKKSTGETSNKKPARGSIESGAVGDTQSRVPTISEEATIKSPDEGVVMELGDAPASESNPESTRGTNSKKSSTGKGKKSESTNEGKPSKTQSAREARDQRHEQEKQELLLERAKRDETRAGKLLDPLGETHVSKAPYALNRARLNDLITLSPNQQLFVALGATSPEVPAVLKLALLMTANDKVRLRGAVSTDSLVFDSAMLFKRVLPGLRSSDAESDGMPCSKEARLWGVARPAAQVVGSYVARYGDLASQPNPKDLEISAEVAAIKREGVRNVAGLIEKVLAEISRWEPQYIWDSYSRGSASSSATPGSVISSCYQAGELYRRGVAHLVPLCPGEVFTHLGAIKWNNERLSSKRGSDQMLSLSGWQLVKDVLDAAVANGFYPEQPSMEIKRAVAAIVNPSGEGGKEAALAVLGATKGADGPIFSKEQKQFLEALLKAVEAKKSPSQAVSSALDSIKNSFPMQDMLSLYVIEDDLKVSVQPKQFQEPAELEYNLDRYLDTILSGYYQATKSSLAFRLTEDEGTYRPHKDKNFRIEMKFGAESLQRFSRLSTILAGTPRGFLLEYLQSNLSK